MQAAPRVFVERVGVLLEVRDQRGAVRARSAGWPRLLISRRTSLALDQAEVAPAARGTSGSARRRRPGPAKPSASTSNWWNWR